MKSQTIQANQKDDEMANKKNSYLINQQNNQFMNQHLIIFSVSIQLIIQGIQTIIVNDDHNGQMDLILGILNTGVNFFYLLMNKYYGTTTINGQNTANNKYKQQFQIIEFVCQLSNQIIIFESSLIQSQIRPWNLAIVVLLISNSTFLCKIKQPYNIVILIIIFTYFTIRYQFLFGFEYGQLILQLTLFFNKLSFRSQYKAWNSKSTIKINNKDQTTNRENSSTINFIQGQIVIHDEFKIQQPQIIEEKEEIENSSRDQQQQNSFQNWINDLIQTGFIEIGEDSKIMFFNKSALSFFSSNNIIELQDNLNNYIVGNVTPLQSIRNSSQDSLHNNLNVSFISRNYKTKTVKLPQNRIMEESIKKDDNNQNLIIQQGNTNNLANLDLLQLQNNKNQISEIFDLNNNNTICNIQQESFNQNLKQQLQQLDQNSSLQTIIMYILDDFKNNNNSNANNIPIISPKQSERNSSKINQGLKISNQNNEIIIEKMKTEKIISKIRIIVLSYQQMKNDKLVNQKRNYAILLFLENQTMDKNQIFQDLYNFKMKIIASISHKLRTPVNCQMSMLQIINSELNNSSIQYQKLKDQYLIPAINNIIILQSYIDDICDYAEMQQGTFFIELSNFDFKQILEECRQIIQYQAAIKQINIEFNIAQNIPDQIRSNQAKLKQIIYNLLSNAIKFSNNQQTVILKVDFNEQTQIISVQIIDQGQGISIQQQRNIFHVWDNNFQSIKNISQARGIGIGLTITNKLAKAIGGNEQMQLQSTLYQGCTFSFFIKNYEQSKKNIKISSHLSDTIKRYSTNTIQFSSTLNSINTQNYNNLPSQLINDQNPLNIEQLSENSNESNDINSQSSEEEKANEPQCMQNINATLQKYFISETLIKACQEEDFITHFNSLQIAFEKDKINQIKKCKCVQILIVDDEIYNIYAMKMMLDQLGIQCDQANDGVQAVEMVKLKKKNECCKFYAIIFMDIDMPNMDGYEASKQINNMFLTEDISNRPQICICSAYLGKEDKYKAQSLGLFNFIDKPVSKQKLVQYLQQNKLLI